MSPVLLAEFDSEAAIVAAARRLREKGVVDLEAYTPYRSEELSEALGLRRTRLAKGVFVAGLAGAILGYLLQWYTSVDYPVDVGGRPVHAAPSFVPITFELTVLFAGTTAMILVFALSRLPRLWQPVFEVEGFERASVDRFWLSVGRPPLLAPRRRAPAPPPDLDALANELLALGALRTARLPEGP